jgi:hypothetical protein
MITMIQKMKLKKEKLNREGQILEVKPVPLNLKTNIRNFFRQNYQYRTMNNKLGNKFNPS